MTPACLRFVTVSRRSIAIAIAALCAACGTSDPVEEIRDLQSRGEFEKTLQPLRELLETQSDDPELRYLYGRALSAAGLHAEAQWSLRRALESDEWRTRAALQLATGATVSGDHEVAIENATIVIEAEPDNVSALLLRASSHVNTRRGYEEALADTERVLEIDPENTTALSLKGAALFGLERVDEGREVVEELARRFNEESLGMERTARYCATRATFLLENEEFEEAEKQFDSCLEEFPSRLIVVDAAVKFHDGRGNYARSLEIMKNALAEAPYSTYRRSVADRLTAMGDPAAAEQVLREGTELDVPEAALASWVHLSHHLVDQGRLDESVDAIEKALAAGGARDPQLLFDHAELLIIAGRLDEAEQAAEKLENEAYKQLVLARIAYERGDAQKALEHYSAGLILYPNNAGARYFAALAAERAGDFDRAISEYRYSIRTDAEATDARLRLAQLHAAEGAPVLALAAGGLASNRVQPDVDAELFALELATRKGMDRERYRLTVRLAKNQALKPRIIAATMRALREAGDPNAALKLLRESGLDLRTPRSAPALREFVECSAALGTADAAAGIVANLIDGQVENADLQAVRGLALERSKADPAEVRAAYDKALELSPDHARALEGMARLREAAGKTDEALSYYERAAAQEDASVESMYAAVRLLRAAGRTAEEEAALDALLARHPYEATAAIRLARLRMARGAEAERTLELAQRAVRFQGGAEAYDLLSELQAARGEAAAAAEAAAEAERLRAATG